MKNNKGITLIALVITIIVLLILSGITISAIVGENGIINQAQKAKVKTLEATEREERVSQGRVEVDGVWYNSVEDYMNDNPIITWETVETGNNNSETTEPVTDETEFEVGDIIRTSTGEYFYVIGVSTDTVTLITKYNLNRRGTAQQDALWTETGCSFAYSNYWADAWRENSEIDLNTYEIADNRGEVEKNEETGMPITETIYNNAILKARNYGSKLGGEGRLITYDEASTIIDSSVELKSIILGDYAINKDERERGLIYWTSTTRNTNDNTVGIVCNTYKSGRTGSSIFVEENSEYDLDGSRHNQYPGVRPVVEMPKSALQ